MNTIAGLCGYIIVIAFGLYTLFCFTAFRSPKKEKQDRVFRKQRACMLTINVLAHGLLYMSDNDFRIIAIGIIQVILTFLAIKIYQIMYKGLSRLVLNNMMMLYTISIFMLERIDIELAIKQLFIGAAGFAICLLVPVIIKKFPYFDRLGWQYAFIGIVFLMLVFFIGVEQYGARNWIVIGGFALQPSEFVKIIYVFFVAAVLTKRTDFKRVVVVSAVAAIHVLVLVVERDLGGALIFFVTYLIVLYVASRNAGYVLLGFGMGSVASVIAYKLFAHVRTRVIAWRDPWSVIDNAGYQVTQSLFAIATGGLFGLGLGRGLPKLIPVVESDFIFAAIAEELGCIFVICLLLVYISCFIMFVNIAMKMEKQFYKLTALGLGVMFIFQVFLAVGGVTKFIPSTGVTLPLVSYGGSSLLSTIMIFSIIQGMYVLNGSEEMKREEKA